MVDLKYNKELYFKDLSQYFAIAVAELFGRRVSVMLNNGDFIHAFVELFPNYYIDAHGVFRNIDERSNFGYNEIVTIALVDFQMFLKSQKIKYTDASHKKCVREYLRNNMLTFDIIHNNIEYTFGLYNIADMFGKEKVLVMMYHGKTGFGSYITNFDIEYFVECIVQCRGFIENPRWYYKN